MNRIRMIALYAVALAGLCLACSSSAASSPELSAQIRQMLASGGGANFDLRELDLAALRDFYDARSYQPAWTGTEPANKDGQNALSALAHAADEGLDPARYHLREIGMRQHAATVRGASEFELLLSDGLLKFISDMRTGRDEFRSMDRDVSLPIKSPNAAHDLQQALADGRLLKLLEQLDPPAPEYLRLKHALARYRRIAAQGDWPIVPGPLVRHLDIASPATETLRRRLSFEDEAMSAEPESDLVGRIETFQRRHGLEADGKVGRLTLAALNVPASERAREIAVNMERWRWLPRDLGPRYIMVNAANATLVLMDHGKVALQSRVIVGKPVNRTAIFFARITNMTINPEWRIPASIARKEIRPKARRNPGYLKKNHIVSDSSGALRQLAGPDNALGQIKFEMPNRFSQYLHDTPSRSLYGRTERHLSHGCIRVEQVKPLASYLLTGDTAAGLGNIQSEIDSGKTKRISLDNPLPVYVVYWTAIANDDGSMEFWPDIYGRDQRLLAAMTGERLIGRVTLNAGAECSSA